jgi:hypothetical protein
VIIPKHKRTRNRDTRCFYLVRSFSASLLFVQKKETREESVRAGKEVLFGEPFFSFLFFSFSRVDSLRIKKGKTASREKKKELRARAALKSTK